VHVRGRLREAKEKLFCEKSFCEKLFCVEKLFCEKLFCAQLFCAEKSFCEKLFCVEKFVLRDVRLRPLSLACSSGAKVRTKPSFDSGGDALLKVGASGRSIQVTVSSFRAPRCSAVER